MLGVRATALDVAGVKALAARLDLFRFTPRYTAPHAIWMASKAFALQTLGREAELDDAVKDALRVLDNPRLFLMQESERQDLIAGLLLIDGINECFRERSQSLERAAALQRMGTQLANAYAKRVRMIYHLVRGEREVAESERKELELHGIHGGTTWQVEWFAVCIEGTGGVINSDLLSVRRALDKLGILVAHVPSLQPFRDMIQIGYHYRRGEYDRTVELGERFLSQHAPRTLTGWPTTYVFVALALV